MNHLQSLIHMITEKHNMSDDLYLYLETYILNSQKHKWKSFNLPSYLLCGVRVKIWTAHSKKQGLKIESHCIKRRLTIVSLSNFRVQSANQEKGVKFPIEIATSPSWKSEISISENQLLYMTRFSTRVREQLQRI